MLHKHGRYGPPVRGRAFLPSSPRCDQSGLPFMTTGLPLHADGTIPRDDLTCSPGAARELVSWLDAR